MSNWSDGLLVNLPQKLHKWYRVHSSLWKSEQGPEEEACSVQILSELRSEAL